MLNFLLQFEHVTVTSSSGSMNMLPTLEEEVRGLFEGRAFFGGEAFRFREDPADMRESRERGAFFAPERPALLIPERSFFSAPDFWKSYAILTFRKPFRMSSGSVLRMPHFCVFSCACPIAD